MKGSGVSKSFKKIGLTKTKILIYILCKYTENLTKINIYIAFSMHVFENQG